MHCKNCDYPLWNIPTRQSPECGTPFVPGEFEFVRNSVQFCCPHCEQVYYCTDAKGHLFPVEFDCVSCGRHTPTTLPSLITARTHPSGPFTVIADVPPPSTPHRIP